MKIYTVFVEAKTPGNIGFLARCMKNFDFDTMVLINPCKLDESSYYQAVHAQDIVENALIYDDAISKTTLHGGIAYWGYQCVYEKNGKSHSAIMLLKSEDGVNFEYVKQFLVPQLCGESKWMAQYVYACCLTYHNNKFRLYFNARNVSNNLLGRESIGAFECEIKQ